MAREARRETELQREETPTNARELTLAAASVSSHICMVSSSEFRSLWPQSLVASQTPSAKHAHWRTMFPTVLTLKEGVQNAPGINPTLNSKKLFSLLKAPIMPRIPENMSRTDFGTYISNFSSENRQNSGIRSYWTEPQKCPHPR